MQCQVPNFSEVSRDNQGLATVHPSFVYELNQQRHQKILLKILEDHGYFTSCCSGQSLEKTNFFSHPYPILSSIGFCTHYDYLGFPSKPSEQRVSGIYLAIIHL